MAVFLTPKNNLSSCTTVTREKGSSGKLWCLVVTGFPTDSVTSYCPHISKTPATSLLVLCSKIKATLKALQDYKELTQLILRLERPKTHRKFNGSVLTVHTIVRNAIPGFSLKPKVQKQKYEILFINITA